MENIIIFNNSSKITKFLGVIFLIFCAFCWYGILSNQEMDALARTITISIALWATLFSLHNILYIDSFSFKKVSKSLCNTKGYFFAHREYTYSSINVKSIELRLASFLVNVNDEGVIPPKNSRFQKKYYAVLILDNDELYIECSNDFEEAKLQVKKLSKVLTVPCKVDLAKKSNSKKNETSILRMFALLFAILFAMYLLFNFLIAHK